MTKLYLSIFVQFFSLYVSSKELKIVNGTVAEIDEYSFMVCNPQKPQFHYLYFRFHCKTTVDTSVEALY